MLVASATYSSRAKSRKRLPAEEKEEERKTTIETALSPSKAPETSARRRSALKGARWKAHLSSSSSSIEGHDYIIILFLLSNGENRKERGKKNEREREKAPSRSCSSCSLSLSFFSQQKRATPVQKSSLAHGGHGGASQPRPCDLPRVADGDEGAGEERGNAAEDREGRDGERLRRRAEGARVGLGVFFFFFPLRAGERQREERKGVRERRTKQRDSKPPPPPLQNKRTFLQLTVPVVAMAAETEVG